MDIIKKFIPLNIYFALAHDKLGNPSTDKVAICSTFLYTFTFAHIFIGIVFSFLNKDLYYTYTEEDGYIEYFTAFVLLATSLLCFYKATQTDERLPMLFFYVAAIVFFLAFGEEISWLTFLGILLIREGEKWKLQEFALANFIFFAFLMPANKRAYPGRPQRLHLLPFAHIRKLRGNPFQVYPRMV